MAMPFHTRSDAPLTSDLEWFANIPKVKLHLQLEGAIPYAALWRLIQKYGGDSSVTTIDHLAAKFRYRNFRHFIETLVWKSQ
jgi:adenosine deaminase